MSSHRVAFLAFKLLGLWLIASAVMGAATMPYIWQTSPSEARGGTAAFLSLPWLVALGIGLSVWFSADWFASRVFPGANVDEGATTALRTEPMFAVGAAIIGLFLLAEGIPALASALYFFGRSLESGVLGPDESRQRLLWDVEGKANALAGITRVVLGLALLAGPAKWAAAVSRISQGFGGSLLEEEKPEQR